MTQITSEDVKNLHEFMHKQGVPDGPKIAIVSKKSIPPGISFVLGNNPFPDLENLEYFGLWRNVHWYANAEAQ